MNDLHMQILNQIFVAVVEHQVRVSDCVARRDNRDFSIARRDHVHDLGIDDTNCLIRQSRVENLIRFTVSHVEDFGLQCRCCFQYGYVRHFRHLSVGRHDASQERSDS